MMQFLKPVVVEVRKEYESERYILVEHDGKTAWLRKSQVIVKSEDELTMVLEIPRRYYNKKF